MSQPKRPYVAVVTGPRPPLGWRLFRTTLRGFALAVAVDGYVWWIGGCGKHAAWLPYAYLSAIALVSGALLLMAQPIIVRADGTVRQIPFALTVVLAPLLSLVVVFVTLSHARGGDAFALVAC